MFEELVEEESRNAEKARIRNKEYKEKMAKLQNENKNISEQIISNQMDRADNHQKLTELKKEVFLNRVANEKTQQELIFAEANIQCLSKHFDDVNSIFEQEKYLKEFFDLKDQQITCLEHLLIDTRLKVANSDEEIEDLKKLIIDLELEVSNLKKLTPATIAEIQDEILQRRYNLAEISAKFKAIERDTQDIKFNWKYCLQDHIDERKNKDFRRANWNLWSKEKSEIKKIVQDKESNIDAMKNEIALLTQKLKELEKQNRDTEEKLKINKKQIIMHNIALDDLKLKENGVDKECFYIENKRHLLEMEQNENITKIHESMSDKNEIMESMKRRLRNLEKEINQKTNVPSKVKEEELENQMEVLEKRVKELKHETTQMCMVK